MNHADMRSIEIRQYDGTPGAASNLNEVVVVRVNPISVGSDELVGTVREAAGRNGVGNWHLEDKRYEVNWGASATTQEVIISVLQAAAEPVVTGTVTALVAELIAWAKKTRGEEAPAYNPPPFEQSDLAFEISWVKRYITDSFGASEDALIVDEARMKPDGAFIVLTDFERRRVYRVEVAENGNLMRFRETRLPGGNDAAEDN